MKNKIYIAGCGGMLGDAFYKKFIEKYKLQCTDINVNENWLSYLDFRDFENYKNDVTAFKPDWLFHLGAYTDLEYCELNQKDTYETNTDSVKHAVNIANGLSIPLLYIGIAGRAFHVLCSAALCVGKGVTWILTVWDKAGLRILVHYYECLILVHPVSAASRLEMPWI